MDGARRPLVAGNWKMHGLKSATLVLSDILKGYDSALRSKVDLLVCPPATLLYVFAVAAVGSRVAIGGQDCHARTQGAHTGEISAEMLADLGAGSVILGHSERRADFGETDALVRAKAEAALEAGLTPIICVGESREDREVGRAVEVVTAHLRGSLPEASASSGLVIAYEPIWAIGTGLTPTPGDVREIHGAIRLELSAIAGPVVAASTRILYGGSVKPGNAAELLAVADVDGALVGGASLVAADFLGIAEAYLAS